VSRDGVEERRLPARAAVRDDGAARFGAGGLEQAAQFRLVLQSRVVGGLDEILPEQVARARDVAWPVDVFTRCCTAELCRRSRIDDGVAVVIEPVVRRTPGAVT
jgi:hypothetical protein